MRLTGWVGVEGGSHTSEEGGAGDASELRQTKETASDLEPQNNT